MTGGQALPLVHIVATGGTIANTPGGRVGIETVIDAVPELEQRARLEVTHTSRLGSAQFRPADWMEIARAVSSAAADPAVSGVVVTHGTFTNEETAYFLHLTVPTRKPVIVVSAQRRHGTLGTDGGRNLYDAVRVAVAPESREHGVMTVLNEDIHSAREVTKTNARPDGFRSRDVGPLGHIDSDRVVFYRQSLRRHTYESEFDIGRLSRLPRVDIIYAYPGADAHTIEPLLRAAAPDGLVVAGLAYSGLPAPDQIASLRAAARAGLPIVLTNRGLEGRVPHPAASSVTAEAPYLYGDNLPPQKARILLMLALTHTTAQPALQRFFDEY